MSMRIPRDGRAALILGTVSFVAGFAWLTTQLCELQLPGFIDHEPLAVLALYLVSPALGWMLARESGDPKKHHGWRWFRVLCLLSPLAVIPPWTITSGKIGIGLGNFGYFVDWLTKYPNLGPVNYKILLGIGCVLGASTVPATFALYASRLREPRQRVCGAFLLAQLLVYVPVLIHLDSGLLLYGFMVTSGTPTSLMGPVVEPVIWESAVQGWAASAGAIARFLSTAGMIGLAISSRSVVSPTHP